MNYELLLGAAVGASVSLTLSLVVISLRRAHHTQDLAAELRASVAALNATLRAVADQVSKIDNAVDDLPCRQCEPPGRRASA